MTDDEERTAWATQPDLDAVLEAGRRGQQAMAEADKVKAVQARTEAAEADVARREEHRRERRAWASALIPGRQYAGTFSDCCVRGSFEDVFVGLETEAGAPVSDPADYGALIFERVTISGDVNIDGLGESP